MQKLLRREFPLETLVISKTLSSTYKDRTRIVQARLADRMRERDPGSAPNVNDRVQYVFVVRGSPLEHKKMLQGDRVEDPAYIRENGIEIDILAYIDHVKKPIVQLLNMVLNEPEKLFKPFEQEEENRRNGILQLCPFKNVTAQLRKKKQKTAVEQAESVQTTLKWLQHQL